MPTLEVLKLKLKPNISPKSPALLKILSQVRTSVKTNSHFYTAAEDPSAIYILGQWPSLSSHHAFLSSRDRSTVLAPQDALATFQWCVHLPLPSDMGEILPLEAPTIALARLAVKSDERSVARFAAIVADYAAEEAGGWRSFGGWVEDGGIEGEYVMLGGWDSVEAHGEWIRERGAVVGLRDVVVGMESVHLSDLERRF